MERRLLPKDAREERRVDWEQPEVPHSPDGDNRTHLVYKGGRNGRTVGVKGVGGDRRGGGNGCFPPQAKVCEKFSFKRSEGSFSMIPQQEEDDEREREEEEEKSAVHDHPPPYTSFSANPALTAQSGNNNGKRKGCGGGVLKCLLRLFKLIKSIGGLALLLLAYTFLGAYIMMKLESPVEEATKKEVKNLREDLFEKLKNRTVDLQVGIITQSEWDNLTNEYLHDFEIDVNNIGMASTSKPKWTFFGSVLFCVTTYTTIGYGNIAPVTKSGRIVTMLYATLGIPLALIILAELGRRLSVAFKFIWGFIRRYYYTGYCRRVRSKAGKGGYDLPDSSTQKDSSSGDAGGRGEREADSVDGDKDFLHAGGDIERGRSGSYKRIVSGDSRPLYVQESEGMDTGKSAVDAADTRSKCSPIQEEPVPGASTGMRSSVTAGETFPGLASTTESVSSASRQGADRESHGPASSSEFNPASPVEIIPIPRSILPSNGRAQKQSSDEDLEKILREQQQRKKDSRVFLDEAELTEDFKLPVSVAVSFIFLYIFLGAGMYTLWEDWTYLESFYFVFITVSTIGYGDVIPKHPNFFLLSAVYTFLGLALVSMMITVLGEFMEKTMERAKEKAEKVKQNAVAKLQMGVQTVKHKLPKRKSVSSSSKESSVSPSRTPKSRRSDAGIGQGDTVEELVATSLLNPVEDPKRRRVHENQNGEVSDDVEHQNGLKHHKPQAKSGHKGAKQLGQLSASTSKPISSSSNGARIGHTQTPPQSRHAKAPQTLDLVAKNNHKDTPGSGDKETSVTPSSASYKTAPTSAPTALPPSQVSIAPSPLEASQCDAGTKSVSTPSSDVDNSQMTISSGSFNTAEGRSGSSSSIDSQQYRDEQL